VGRRPWRDRHSIAPDQSPLGGALLAGLSQVQKRPTEWASPSGLLPTVERLRKGERELVGRKAHSNLVGSHYVQALSAGGGEWLASFS